MTKMEKVAEVIRAEMATLNVEVVASMSREAGPTDLTPFMLLAVAAVKSMSRPDIDMVEAGYLVHPNHYGAGFHLCVVHYRIMMDTALKGY